MTTPRHCAEIRRLGGLRSNVLGLVLNSACTLPERMSVSRVRGDPLCGLGVRGYTRAGAIALLQVQWSGADGTRDGCAAYSRICGYAPRCVTAARGKTKSAQDAPLATWALSLSPVLLLLRALTLGGWRATPHAVRVYTAIHVYTAQPSNASLARRDFLVAPLAHTGLRLYTAAVERTMERTPHGSTGHSRLYRTAVFLLSFLLYSFYRKVPTTESTDTPTPTVARTLGSRGHRPPPRSLARAPRLVARARSPLPCSRASIRPCTNAVLFVSARH